MKKGIEKWIISCLLTLFVWQNGIAQDELNHLKFEHLTVDEGLAHSDAMTVVQDPDGFVWVGTNNGINRYDGYELKRYELPSENSPGRSAGRIQVLHVDKRGTMWVGTEGAGLYFYDKERDSFFSIRERIEHKELSENIAFIFKSNIKSIDSDGQGRLWIATYDYGLLLLSFENSGRNIQLKKIHLQNGLSGNYSVSKVLADKNNRIWIGTLDYGLWTLSGNGYNAKKVTNFPETDIRSLYLDRNEKLWLSSFGTVYHLENSEFNSVSDLRFQKIEYIFHGVQCLYSDAYKRFWIGTNFGLVMIRDVEAFIRTPDKNLVSTFLPQDTNPASINSARVHQIIEDSFSNLWLAASAGGLNKVHLTPKKFGHLRRQVSKTVSLPNNYINAICKDERENQLWIGTRNGFSIYDLHSKSFRNHLDRLSLKDAGGIDVSSFLATEKNVWVGTRYQGIYRMQRDNPGVVNKLTAPYDHARWSHISVERMIEDGSKRIWAAAMGAGILLFDKDGKYIQTFNKQNTNLPTNDFSFLLYDKEKDIIWASTKDAGVLKLQEKEGELRVLNQYKFEENNPNSLKVNFAWPLLKDSKGSLWIGTIGGGLHKLSIENGKEKIERFGSEIFGNDIESLLADEQENIWIGGAGLNKFDPKTGTTWHYDVSDGLQSNSFKVGSAYKSQDGTMYFGGTNGITFFKPSEILSNPSPPVVRITQLRVLNKNPDMNDVHTGSSMVSRPFSGADGVVIKSDENDFSFQFVGLNYVNPEKQTYAFMLEGYNRDWVHLPVGQRVASFANLPAGEYIFKVKANNGDGVWSAESASVLVKILPPWYKTWWAYSVYLLLAISGLLLYRRISMHQLQLRNRISIEKLHAEKEKEIAELKTNFFTSISHEFRTPLTLILGPMEEFMHSLGGSESMKEKVSLMHKQTQKLLNLVNQLLSFRKIESGHASLAASRGDIIHFLKEIYEIFKVKAQQRQLDYSIDIPAGPLQLYFDPVKLEIVITNLLSNAFKYTSKQGRIRFSVEMSGSSATDAVWQNEKLTENFLIISVSDSGLGINTDELEQIFNPYFRASNSANVVGTGIGLALVQEFVKSHHGEVQVESSVGKGSCFTVKLPFGKAHLSADELREGSSQPQFLQEISVSKKPVLTPIQNVFGRMKILIVEDNEDLRSYLETLLDSNYETFACENGLDGWNKAVDWQPDLIVSDVMMPVMNGLEFCKKIKQNPKTSHIPVVLLTARAAATQELEGLETGADDYIAKPFHAKILLVKISNILQNRIKSREFYQRQILLQPTEVVIPDEDKSFLETAMKVVEDNLVNSEFNVQALVSAMAMSQSVFYRRLKNITGQSVIEFIKDIRLKRAAQLLANPHSRIGEVAFLVGIEDPKNFRASFQKVYNMSPSQYAKMYRTSQNSESAPDNFDLTTKEG